MHITYQALIAKLEEEVRQAKRAKTEEEIRGHLFAVRALTELMLEGGGEQQGYVPEVSAGQPKINKVRPKEEVLPEETSGDDSIFDF